jgi:hypothetical protein
MSPLHGQSNDVLRFEVAEGRGAAETLGQNKCIDKTDGEPRETFHRAQVLWRSIYDA